jgi:hypothetical protein
MQDDANQGDTTTMKLSTALLLLATAAHGASAQSIRKPVNKAKILSLARRLEEAQGDDAANQQEDQQYEFLGDYSLKMIGCSSEQYQDPENGEYEYGSVVVRLCPSASCDDEGVGCSAGYGDYVIGINTFVEAWLRDKEEDMQDDANQGDDQWDMNEFAECREFEVDQDADEEDGGDEAEEVAYYVGPTCIDGSSIGVGFFSDYTCTTKPDGVSFEDISNGWSLPYEDGGLVTSYCESCAGTNDNGEYELGEMCTQLYEKASSKCEGKMETYSANGKDDSGCDYITSSFPSTVAKSSSSVGMVILWILIALVVCGGLFFVYTKWWMKRKQGSAANLSSSDGVAA